MLVSKILSIQGKEIPMLKSLKKQLSQTDTAIEKILIDTFVNSVVFYDDRIDFYFDFKDNAKSLTLSELNTVSDLSSSSPPKKTPC